MSGGRRASEKPRARRGTAAREAPRGRSGGSGTRRPAAASALRKGRRDDPVSIYREAASYGPVFRSLLAVALLALCLSALLRALHRVPPEVIGDVGLVAMLFFVSAGVVKHTRGFYRVRRHHPETWSYGAEYTRAMLLAPFGIGDPQSTRYDQLLRRTCAILALVLVMLVLAGRGA